MENVEQAVEAEIFSIDIKALPSAQIVEVEGETRFIKESDFKAYRDNLRNALTRAKSDKRFVSVADAKAALNAVKIAKSEPMSVYPNTCVIVCSTDERNTIEKILTHAVEAQE